MSKVLPTPKPPADLPFRKAGVVLCGNIKGEDGKERMHFVAPYSEGRFGDNYKFYVFGAGLLDPGEDVLTTALREATEETGIDMRRLLGDDNIAKLRRGEPVENVESGFPGVRIKRVAPQALDYVYRGREDSLNHTALLRIEVEGLEHLRGELKNQPNVGHRLGKTDLVTHPARTFIADHANYPSYRERIDWLRQMRIPGKFTSDGKDKPLAPMHAGPHPKDWFNCREEFFMARIGKHGQKIDNVADMQSLQNSLSAEDFATLRDLAEQVKAELKKTGLIGRDDNVIKFDTKDSPLSFYQEGADILTAEEYLAGCIYSGRNRKDYTKAFCGNTPDMAGAVPDRGRIGLQEIIPAQSTFLEPGHANRNLPRAAKPLPRAMRITNSQFGAVVWAVGEQPIKTVAANIRRKAEKNDTEEYEGKKGDNNPYWLGGKLRDDSFEKDMLKACKTLSALERPITEILSQDAALQSRLGQKHDQAKVQ